MCILITGAAGLIGRERVRGLRYERQP